MIALVILAVGTPPLAWALSQASPAWANRYLAVALAPFLLLAAGGLAHARRLGIVGLVLVVIMWAQDAAPVEKSNVRAVAHAIGPSLAPGDLVISTQPETIPVLHYYLPDGLRYATLTGEVTGATACGTGATASSGWRRTTPQRNLAAADRLAAGRDPRRAGGADHVDAQPLAGAVDVARPDPLQGVGAGALERPAAAGRRRPADEFTPPRPNPVQATVMVKTR